jgi:hypothetical protein
MRCKDINLLLSEYVDGVLEPDRVEMLEAHLAKCEHCRRELEYIRETVALLQELDEVAPPDDLLQRVHARLHDEAAPVVERRTQGNRLWFVLNMPPVRLALAASLLGIVTIHMLHDSGSVPKVVDTRVVPDLAAEQARISAVDKELPADQAPADNKVAFSGTREAEAAMPAEEAVFDVAAKFTGVVDEEVSVASPSLPAVVAPVVASEARLRRAESAEAEGSIWGVRSAPVGLRDTEPQPEPEQAEVAQPPVASSRRALGKREAKAKKSREVLVAAEPNMDRAATDAMAEEEVMIKREAVSGLVAPALTVARSRRALSPKGSAMLRLETDDKEVVGGAARSIEVVVVTSDTAAVLTQIARLALSHEGPGDAAWADRGRSEARSDAASAVAADRLVDDGTGVIRARVESARYAELIASLQALGKTTTQERSTGGATSVLKESKALDVGTAKRQSVNGQILDLTITIVQP